MIYIDYAFLTKKALFLEQFEECRETLTAMGDSTRQLIIRSLMEHSGEKGLRVGDIQKETNISRTAVSHHLKILKESGIINMRKESTKNYYYLDAQSSSIQLVVSFWNTAQEMMSFCPLREENHR